MCICHCQHTRKGEAKFRATLINSFYRSFTTIHAVHNPLPIWSRTTFAAALAPASTVVRNLSRSKKR
jgi:hypothetical protein